MKQRFSLSRPKESIINIDLQLSLFNTWIKHGVGDYYQNIFLAYLDELTTETVEFQIKREIKQTIQKNNFYFLIQNLQEERHALIKQLQLMLVRKNGQIPHETIQQICVQVSKLRGLNLQIAENLIKMYQKFKCCNYQSLQRQNSFYQGLFDDLDKQNYFIKKSFLNRYIKFDEGYDPFLMDPYEKFHRGVDYEEKESIKSLFNLNISLVYRLMRAKNSILEIRSKFKEAQPAQQQSKASKRSRIYRHSQQKAVESPRVAPQMSNYKEFELKTVPKPEKKQILSVPIQPIKISPIKVFPSRQKSRTTVHPINEDRSKSPMYSDKYNELVFSRVSRTDSIEYEQPRKNQRVHNQIHFETQPSDYPQSSQLYKQNPYNEGKLKKYGFHNEESTNNYSAKLRPYRLEPIHIEKSVEKSLKQSQISKIKEERSKQIYSEPKKSARLGIVKEYEIKEQFKPLPEPKKQEKVPQKQQNQITPTSTNPIIENTKPLVQYDDASYQIRHYNPITKNQFQKIRKQKHSSFKYDLNTRKLRNDIISQQDEPQGQQGLLLEMPICKFNSKKKFYPKRFSICDQNPTQNKPNHTTQNKLTKRQMRREASSERKIQKTVPFIEKVQQQSQTIENTQRPQPIIKPNIFSEHVEREVVPSKSLEREVLPSKPIEKEIPPAKPKEREVLQSKSIEREVLPSKLIEKEVLPSKPIEKEIPPAKPKEREILPPTIKRDQPQIQIQQKQSSKQASSEVMSGVKVKDNIPSKPPSQQQIAAVQQKKKQIQKQVVKQPAQEDALDQTLENQIIIDERSAPSSSIKAPIRVVPKQQAPSPEVKPPNPPIKIHQATKVVSQKQTSERKQVKMKIGKLTITETIALIQISSINPEYKALFGMQKLIEAIKMNQTYLTQFHVNNVCAIIALCSIVPGIGMAIRFWAPIQPSIDQNASNNIFLKYVQFIQKTTTVDKLMFSGNCDAFKELKIADFTMKRQNLYERLRKTPAKQIELEFKPFLYIECSAVNFNQTGGESVLFSEQIEQFTELNSHAPSFLAQIDKNSIPNAIQPFVRISQGLKDFSEVNNILSEQQFDNYEAGAIKASPINLLRFSFNTHFKGTFIACEGYLQFVGTLLFQKGEEKLVSLPTAKNNGFMYFAKNMSLSAMIQRYKTSSNNKARFCVKMFHKILYGRLPGKSKGCYGNWEINLTWEDEMQGKVKHNLPQGISFGPESFCIGIEIEKELLYCVEITKQDFIY